MPRFADVQNFSTIVIAAIDCDIVAEFLAATPIVEIVAYDAFLTTSPIDAFAADVGATCMDVPDAIDKSFVV